MKARVEARARASGELISSDLRGMWFFHTRVFYRLRFKIRQMQPLDSAAHPPTDFRVVLGPQFLGSHCSSRRYGLHDEWIPLMFKNGR